MVESLIPVVSALWLGILTSVNPCPLASNIAAVSFIMQKMDKSSTVFTAGVMYTIGRAFGYAVLGVLIAASLLNIPQTAHFLQKYMNQLLGPVLIITGVFLLNPLKFTFGSTALWQTTSDRLSKLGTVASFPLGVLFALSFCPSSAALFFGSLIPLTLKHESSVLFPSIYGIGTGLPVLLFAFAIAVGVKNVETLFHRVTMVESWTRKITGAIVIIIGIYYILTHIFYIQVF